MIDGPLFITIVPPVFAALIAYAIARIKSNANERIQKAKLEAEIDTRAMELVKSIVEEMRVELKAEIANLREENKSLREVVTSNREEIETLQRRLHESAELQSAMKIEIASLKTTIQWYEKRLKNVDLNGGTFSV
jgi:chromosome segregation ATPase